MENKEYVLEVAIFTIKEGFADKLPQIRTDIHKALQNFTGFIEINSLSPIDEKGMFADIVKWNTLDDALIAAKAFEDGDPRFLPYMEAADEVTFMGHFKS